jgi:transposase
VKLDMFEEVQEIYQERYKIERCFAWEDSYRKLVIRYETLQCTFMGFRYLAYSMVNLRKLFG